MYQLDLFIKESDIICMQTTPWSVKIFFIFTLCWGMWLAESSWNGMIYVLLGDARGPAAVDRRFDLSGLQGSALRTAANKLLLQNVRLLPREDGVGIEFGHFAAKSSSGRTAPACQIYDKIEITLIADEMADSGTPAEVSFEAPCNESKDSTRIAPIWLPLDRLYRELAKDGVLQIFEEPAISMQYHNIGSSWPQKWAMTSVRLFSSENPDQQLKLDAEQIKEVLNKPFTFIWKSSADKSKTSK